MSTSILSAQVMHGEDYVCLGFLFGRKERVAYLSDVSRLLPRTEHGTTFQSSTTIYSNSQSRIMIIYGQVSLNCHDMKVFLTDMIGRNGINNTIPFKF